MTVRAKILVLSAALLLLFAVVLASSMVMQTHGSNKVAGLVEFHLPLTALISDLDVATSDYELMIERMLRRDRDTPTEQELEQAKLQRIKARIASDFDAADALVARALSDPRTDVSDRLVLARVQRSITYLERLTEPFFTLGDQVLDAHVAGHAAEARRLSFEFEKFEQSFGSDLPAVRAELSALARASTENTHTQQGTVLRLNLLLFAVAVVLGLGLSAAGAKRLVGALRRL